MLEVKNLCVSYGKEKILDNINLTFEKGLFYAVLGRNGAGKSTLARSIMSLTSYDGQILLDGRNIAEYSPCERAKRISYLPQKLSAVPFTARELIGFGRTPYGDLKGKGGERVLSAMELLDISHLEKRRVNSLSGGERQLCYFAMNLCQDTDIMLLDEPNSSCDIVNEGQMFSVTKDKCLEGKTAICIFHNLAYALKLADRLILLDKGSCVFSGTPKECKACGVLERVFGVTNDGLFM